MADARRRVSTHDNKYLHEESNAHQLDKHHRRRASRDSVDARSTSTTLDVVRDARDGRVRDGEGGCDASGDGARGSRP
jgi:hypothetical protein